MNKVEGAGELGWARVPRVAGGHVYVTSSGKALTIIGLRQHHASFESPGIYETPQASIRVPEQLTLPRLGRISPLRR